MSPEESKKDEEQPEDERVGTEIPTADQEMLRLREENTRLDDRLKRAMADLANFRKRQLKDLEDARRRTLEALASELLPILDSFQFALDACEQDQGAGPGATRSLAEGIVMVRGLLSGTLARYGIEPMKDEGEPFDPSRHEAVSVAPPSGLEEGIVVKVLLTGYTIGDKVLRSAKVLVSGPPDGPPSGSESEQE